jgi:spermidine synthase
LVGVGVVSMGAQVVLLRELAAAFYGVELVYVLALGAWLFSTALGALVGGRIGQPAVDERGARPIAFALAGSGVLIVADVLFVRGVRVLFGGIPGAFLPFPHQLAAIIAAVLPPGVLLGVLFQRSARRYLDDGGTIGRAYAIESGGALLGGIGATAFMMVGLPNLALALACCLLGVLAAAALLRARDPRLARALTAGAMLVVILSPNLGALDRATARWTHPDLTVTGDSPYGRISVTESAGQISVFQNDALAFESHSTMAETFAHLVALQADEPRTALVLGGGVEGLITEVLKHDPHRVEYVEENRMMFAMVRPLLPPTIAAGLASPRVSIVFADPRAFVARVSSSYDLILVGMPQPESGQANRFYTSEFFRLCAARLTPTGVLGIRLQSSENFWTPQTRARSASVFRALRSALSDVVVLPGATDVLIASRAPLPHDPEILVKRFDARQLTTRLVGPSYLRYVYRNDRFADVARTLAAGLAVYPANTDARPVVYQQTTMIWLSKFYASLALVSLPTLPAFAQWPRWLQAATSALVLALMVAARLSRRLRPALLVLVAAFAGMVCEMVLLLHYQTKRGVMYQDMGVLLAAVMAGLAVGAWGTQHWASREGHPPPGRLTGLVLLAALGVLNVGVAILVERGRATALPAVAMLLVATGALIAALFVYAAMRGRRDAPTVFAPLYAADLAGGALASLVGSLVLIPLAGLDLAAWWMAALAAIAMLLL